MKVRTTWKLSCFQMRWSSTLAGQQIDTIAGFGGQSLRVKLTVWLSQNQCLVRTNEWPYCGHVQFCRNVCAALNIHFQNGWIWKGRVNHSHKGAQEGMLYKRFQRLILKHSTHLNRIHSNTLNKLYLLISYFKH